MKQFASAVLTLAIVFCLSHAFAQTDKSDTASFDFAKELNKVFNTKVTMDVDTVLFDSKQNNFYMSEASKAMLMTMVAPQSFEKAEEHFENENKKKGYKVLEKKKFTHNGRKVLYQKGVLKNKGEKAFMYLYAMEANSESTIFITGMHMDGDEKKFFPAIERAALSAKLANQK